MKHSAYDRSAAASYRRRTGSLIIESVVATALLATALVALGKLAATSAAISQTADQRLAATLIAENVLERLKVVEFDAVPGESAEIAASIQQSCPYEVQVTGDAFLAGDREARHIIVTVRPSLHVTIQLHDWRVRETSAKDNGDG